MMMMRWCGGRDLEHMKKNNGDLEAEYFFHFSFILIFCFYTRVIVSDLSVINGLES